MTTTNQPDDYNESAIRRVQQQLAQEPTGQYVDPGHAAPKSTGPEQPGTILGGRYKLLENIGEGGMGSVWVAEQQQPVKRRVAIKLVKAGMDSKQVLARFEAERQALAVMDHPNIAKVFDGGMTEQGRPYFVMEYVKGVPFTDYCDKARLSLKERLNLFVPVCQAVQHAHHKGIIHRDLKPSNILICLYDGHPVPKVIDFGLAKAMHQPLTDRSIYTGHGLMIGTPMYMSPEQAELNNLDIDTRTDVYSLGVVLYEILVGTTPLELIELQTAAYDEVLRLIKEVEPPRPSIRLSASASLPSIAAQRSIDPRELRRSLAGELDWIVMKSLEKERSRRYETVNGLSRDIERFLNDEAVEACPPSRVYQLKKLVKKHKGKVIATTAVLCTLLLGLIGTTWQSYRATRAEQAAKVSEQKAIESEQAAVASEQKTLEALGQVTLERDAKEAQRQLAEAATMAETKQREHAERQLIYGLLRPIGYGETSDYVYQPNVAEFRAFIDIAAISDSRLKMRVLEVGLEDPEIALRLARRAGQVIQSTVCLSPSRWAKAIELMCVKQRDMNSDPRIRVAAAWLALDLGLTDTTALAEASTWLAESSSETTSSVPSYGEFIDFMAKRIDSLSPEQLELGGDALIKVLENSTDNVVLHAAGEGLAALAPKLSPEQVMRSWDTLMGILKENSTNYNVLHVAAKSLAALAPKLSPEQAMRGGDVLIGNLEKSTDREVLYAVSDGLAALAPTLTPEQITRCGDTLIGILEKSTDEYVLYSAGAGLAALAQKLSPEQAMRGGDALIGSLEKNQTNYNVLHAGSECLAALAPKLSPEQVMRSWDTLIGILEENSINYSVLPPAGDGLAALAQKLSLEQVTHGGGGLINVLENSTNDFLLYVASEGLAALAPKLSPEQVVRGWDALIGVLEKSTNDNVLFAAGEGLVALAPKLSPEQVMRGCDSLNGFLEKSTNDNVLFAAGEGLATLATQLSPEQSSRSVDFLISLLEKSTDENFLRVAGEGLAALAPKFDPDSRVRAAEWLVDCQRRGKHFDISKPMLQLMLELESSTRERISIEYFSIALDSAGFYYHSQDELSYAVMAITNQRQLALFLQHPAVGRSHELREFMLQRFEELVLHDGRRVHLPLPKFDEKSTVPSADYTNATSANSTDATPAVKTPRQFHTIHDAAAWIEKNWPDFDLEATHPVTMYSDAR